MNFESNNLKATRITLIVIAILGVILVFLKVPKTNELNSVKSQITATSAEIQDAKASAKSASPLNNNGNFNLVEAEGNVQDKVNKGSKMGLGGLKNTKDYNAHKEEIASSLSSLIFSTSLINSLSSSGESINILNSLFS